MKYLSIKNLSVCLLSCSLFVSTAYANNLSNEVAKETEVRSVIETGLQALYVDADAAVVDQYFAEDYIQHNPFGLSGVDFAKNVFIVNRPRVTTLREGS